jgi:LPXTG-motif cell wall-anchored protein
MSRAWVMPARAFAVLVSMIMLMFTLGVATPASADPGNKGNNNAAANGNSAAAHEKNEDRKSGSTSTTSTTASTGGDDAAASRSSGNGASKSRSSKKSSTSAASSHQTSTKHGDYDKPQPESNADRNDGGANAGDCPGEPYCSTRDGSPSMNGNGGGTAKGKPCAGCVGKADNKNPPGQVKEWKAANGKIRGFGNKGYECDDNNGIGKGNPAHTGCTPTPPPPPPCPDWKVAKYGKDCLPDECPDWKVAKYGKDCLPDECPDWKVAKYGKDCLPDECVPSAVNNFCDEGTPPECPEGQVGTPPNCGEIAGEEEFSPPPGKNRPPTVKGVEQFATPPAVAPQAGALPSTGAASMTGALTTLGFALLAMGGVLVGLRRQLRAPAVR